MLRKSPARARQSRNTGVDDLFRLHSLQRFFLPHLGVHVVDANDDMVVAGAHAHSLGPMRTAFMLT